MFGWIVVGLAASPLALLLVTELWDEARHALFMRRYCEPRPARGPLGVDATVIEGVVVQEIEA